MPYETVGERVVREWHGDPARHGLAYGGDFDVPGELGGVMLVGEQLEPSAIGFVFPFDGRAYCYFDDDGAVMEAEWNVDEPEEAIQARMYAPNGELVRPTLTL